MFRKIIFIFYIILSEIFLSPIQVMGYDEVNKKENESKDNYYIYFLTGDELLSRKMSINDLTIDTGSTESINTSIRNIINSKSKINVVTEVHSKNSNYTIDYTAASKPVSDIFYGFNMQWMSKHYLTMPKYRELVKNIKIDILRFPGGQERVRYDRNADQNINDELGMDQPYQFVLTGKDIENYISFCKELNIEAEPEVNIYNYDYTMCRNMIDQIVNELRYNLKYVSIGNEPDVNVFSGWKYLEAINKDQALDHYMDRYKKYYDAINSVKKNMTLSICELAMWAKNELDNNLDRMLNQINGKYPGAISTHWYMLGDYGQSSSNSDFPSLENIVISNNNDNEIRYLSKIYNILNQKKNKYVPDAKLFIGEWGVAWSATPASTKILDRLATAIFNAEVIEYCKILGFDSIQFFGISDPKNFYPWNPALIAVDVDNFTLRPQYYLYMLYKYAWGNKIVKISNNQTKDYSIYASMDNNFKYIMLINRTENKNFKKIIKVITDKGVKFIKVIIYAKSVTFIKF